MTVAFDILLLVLVAGGLWLIDRRAAARLAAAVPALEKAAKASTLAIATEFDLRLAQIVRGEVESRGLLATATARLAGCEAALSLLPAAMGATRELLNQKFQEWEEKQVPPEGQEIAASAMSRIRSHRENIVRLEEDSLKKFEEASKVADFRPPLIRVRAGD